MILLGSSGVFFCTDFCLVTSGCSSTFGDLWALGLLVIFCSLARGFYTWLVCVGENWIYYKGCNSELIKTSFTDLTGILRLVFLIITANISAAFYLLSGCLLEQLRQGRQDYRYKELFAHFTPQ